MANNTMLFGSMFQKALGQLGNDPYGANAYLKALQQAAYSDAGQQYGQGLGQVTNYLSNAGPLYDSGAATALRTRLASNIYGQANSRIGNQYAGFLGNAMQANRAYQYQMALLRQQHKYQSTGFGGVMGGLAGGLAGSALGPIGTAIGTKVGSYF